jgi:hypothetical protein
LALADAVYLGETSSVHREMHLALEMRVIALDEKRRLIRRGIT